MATGDWTWPWPVWNATGTTTATQTYYTNYIGNVWTQWNVTGTTASTIPTNTWRVWVDPRSTAFAPADDAWKAREAQARAVWEAGAAERVRQAAERVRTAAALGRKRKAASARALRLLMSILTPEQRDEYRRLSRFHVIGSDGRKYRIRRGWHHNVELVEETAEGAFLTEQFCIAPRNEMPEEDNLVAQKLMIEGNLVDFRRIANITRMRRAA